jgi:beta-glucanase (GH16 family)
MKKRILILLFLVKILSQWTPTERGISAQGSSTFLIPDSMPINSLEKKGWELIFQDEFLGDTLNTQNWWAQECAHGDEAQWYTPRKENIYVKEGLLHIRALKDSIKQGYPYTSGILFSSRSFGKGSYIEIRCKIPKGQGLWPAFWLWKGFEKTYHEVDVFEFWCNNTYRFSISNHYWDDVKQKKEAHWRWIYPKTSSGKRIDMSKDYFTYAIYWDDTSLKCSLNNALFEKQTQDIPQDPFPILLNMAVEGGKYAPKSTLVFPQEFLIDYVRVYKRK